MIRRRYRVDWTEVARGDLFGVVDYLRARDPEVARFTLDRLQRRANSLKKVPGRGRLVPELERLQIREYRELVSPPYRLVYRVSGSTVLVLAVLDSRRNIEDVLLERLVSGR